MKARRLLSMILLLIASAEWVLADVTITRQPTNITVSVDATVQFSSVAISTAPPIAYQWRFKEVAMDTAANPSAATRTLSLTNVTLAHAGAYDVVVTDSSGSATSQAAVLTVDGTFTKITQGPVATDVESSEAPIWWDYDHDGKLDLFVPNARGSDNPVRSSLYRNDGDGSFTKVTNVITTPVINALNAAVGDFNNDGWDDLFVVQPNGADALYQNRGGGDFVKLSKTEVGPPVGDVDHSMDAGWADYDRDGFLDLFVVNAYFEAGDDHLYHNTGNGSFIKMKSSEVGVLVADNLLTGPCAWADYDNDGFPDMWVGTSLTQANPSGRQFLYHNDEGRGFSQVSAGSLTNNLARGIGQWADYDNDGYLDLFLTSWTGAPSLHRNLGGVTFTDVSQAAGVDNAMRQTWAAAWGDYDNDGFLDLIVLSDSTLSALYHNDGAGTFTSVDVGSPLRDGSGTVHAGVAWADYDSDGSLDLVVACGDGVARRNFLYRNNGNSNNWLKIKLTGTASNRSAIGAKVRVTAAIAGKQVRQMREISGNSGCSGGAGGLVAHFGLGDATNVDLVRIEWPSGNVQEQTDVAPNQSLTIQETVSITPSMPSVSLNGSVTLESSLSGNYQWRFNGTAIANATDSSLTLEGVQANQAGRYSVVVTSAGSVIVTNHVYLRVDSTFTKITEGPLVSELGNVGQPAWGDFDGDGYSDILVTFAGQGLSTLYFNNRDGTFRASPTLPSQNTADLWYEATTADFDNDGQLDLYVPRWDKTGFFYFNNGDGTFTPSEFEAADLWNAAAADYDRDGLLDLFLSNAGRLYRNSGDRRFTRAGTYGTGLSGGAAWGDYDDDGWPDLFCGSNTGITRLFRNDRAGGFLRVTNAVTQGKAFVGAWGDYDNDGRLDVCSAPFGGTGGTVQVYRNLGGGEFEQAATGQTISGKYNGVCWADYDNDGFLDLFLTTGNGVPNRLYRGNGDGTFTRVQTGSIVTELPTGGTALWSYFPSWFDYDNDGFLDLFVPNGNDAVTAQSASFLYHNNANENAWLKVKLVGTASNHDGVGAKVRARAKYADQIRWQRRDISAGDVANGGNLIAHFGLGDATNVMTLKIEWPSGAVQELANVAPRQFLTVWEPPALKATAQEDGACQLMVTAEPNRTWRIEGSEDLATWKVVARVTNTTPTFDYTDSESAAMVCRFYRVVAE